MPNWEKQKNCHKLGPKTSFPWLLVDAWYTLQYSACPTYDWLKKLV